MPVSNGPTALLLESCASEFGHELLVVENPDPRDEYHLIAVVELGFYDNPAGDS